MIRIAVVEDEQLYGEQLLEYIRRYEKERAREIKVTLFTDGEDIVDGYKGGYDIILMDIQMQFMDGMSAAEEIRKMDSEVIIMFITNMIQYAIRGYQVDALDYVVKPVEYFAFSQKLDKAVSRLKKADTASITIPIEDGIKKLSVSDILYVESRGHNALFFTVHGMYMARMALKDLEEKLKKYSFFRCSKGFLVNMARVDGVVNGECVIGEQRIPIGRAKKKEFMEELLKTMDEE